MNTPNPLMPQGSLHQNQSRGNSTVRIAVFAVVALHAVFFAGLLMQGCRPEGDSTGASNTSSTDTNSINELARLESNYFESFNELPPVTSAFPQTNATALELESVIPPASDLPSAPLANTAQPGDVMPSDPPQLAVPAETKEHIVVRGDYLFKIAGLYRVSVDAIVEANPGIQPALIRPGQKIIIPAPVPAGSTRSGFREPGASDVEGNMYVIQAGDNLSRIAKRYKLSVADLKAANNLRTDRILAGKKLIIPSSGASSTNPASGQSGTNL